MCEVKISERNNKLGNIRSFSTSAGKTCLESDWCGKKCYAKRLEKRFPNVRKAYEINYKAIDSPEFVSTMIDNIKNEKDSIFRINVSGDFHLVKYIYDWIKIIDANPTVNFYAYTHSWTNDELLPHLEILNNKSNMTLLLSLDDSNVQYIQPKHATFRFAYSGDNKPATNNYVDCPQQTKKVKYCTDCKLCFNTKINTNIFFITH